MIALITGASSGMGEHFAYLLSDMGYDLILASRNKNKLEEVKKKCKTNVKIFNLDLCSSFNVMKLYNNVKEEDIDIIINNAGFGLMGEFYQTKLDRELDMIDLNIKALHMLIKLFLTDFIKKDRGYILNVASIASFYPGPLMATYYATKNYVYNLTMSISYELKKRKSKVYIGTLNPGPVNTNFNNVAGVSFDLKSLEASYVCKYAIDKMFKGKKVIIPGISNKIAYYSSKFLPLSFKLKSVYNIQKKKL